jgi:hypothetical protein
MSAKIVGTLFGCLVIGIGHVAADDVAIRSTFAQDDTIWVATSDGLWAWDISNNLASRYKNANELPSDDIISVQADSSHGLWISTQGGVARRSGSQWISWDEDVNLGSVAISFYVGKDATAWASYSHAISRFKGGARESQEYGDVLVGAGEFYQTASGDMWFVALYPSESLFRYSNGTWETWTTRDVIETQGTPEDFTEIAEDHEGNVWVAGRYGRVARFDGKGWKHWSREDGLEYSDSIFDSDRKITGIFPDNQGNIWVWGGTGLNRYNGEVWYSYSQMFWGVGDVTLDRRSTVWATSLLNDIKVAQFDGTTWNLYPLDTSSPPRALYVDVQNRIWGIGYNSLWVYELNTWRQWAGSPMYADLTSMVEGRTGEMWFWGPDHIVEFKDGVWKSWLFTDIGMMKNNNPVTVEVHPIKGVVVNSGANDIIYYNGDEWLKMSLSGSDIPTTVAITESAPTATTLRQNYPNPFNAQTTISYHLSQAAQVALVIYDIAGRRVKTVVNELEPEGYYQILWDGVDDLGNKVGSGIYFYRLEAGPFQHTRRLVLLK